jgi:hypothetical protein
MAFAINLTARSLAGARIRDLWNEFGVCKPVPSMAALNHPPHITLAIYNNIDEGHSTSSSGTPIALSSLRSG